MKDNKALVVSEYAIDVKPYNTNCKAATWETCTLRKWLNSTFINEAFDINEQMVIQETELKTEATAEGMSDINTKDKIFLLSIDEVNKYFNPNQSRMCNATKHAIEEGAYCCNEKAQNSNSALCCYWLRSAAIKPMNGTTVNCVGVINQDEFPVNQNWVGIRPTMWISLKNSF